LLYLFVSFKSGCKIRKEKIGIKKSNLFAMLSYKEVDKKSFDA